MNDKEKRRLKRGRKDMMREKEAQSGDPHITHSYLIWLILIACRCRESPLLSLEKER